MTPKRQAYLAKCSKRERTIRHLIKYYKTKLKEAKAVCSSYNLKMLGRKPFGYRIHIVSVYENKLILNTLRHELARLKEMDRVCVPRVSFIGIYDVFQRVERCSCGERLMSENHCPNCGRYILRNEVKV